MHRTKVLGIRVSQRKVRRVGHELVFVLASFALWHVQFSVLACAFISFLLFVLHAFARVARLSLPHLEAGWLDAILLPVALSALLFLGVFHVKDRFLKSWQRLLASDAAVGSLCVHPCVTCFPLGVAVDLAVSHLLASLLAALELLTALAI